MPDMNENSETQAEYFLKEKKMNNFEPFGRDTGIRNYRYDVVLNAFERATLHDALKAYKINIENTEKSCSKTLNEQIKFEAKRAKDIAEKFEFDDFGEINW